MTRRFLSVFLPLYLLIGGVAVHYLPLPLSGGGPLPEWVVEQENQRVRIFDALVFPARWAGGADLFLGPAIWALVFSLPIAWCLHQRSKKAPMRNR